MSETFLSRWSRRKRAASIPPPQGEGGDARASGRRRAGEIFVISYNF